MSKSRFKQVQLVNTAVSCQHFLQSQIRFKIYIAHTSTQRLWEIWRNALAMGAVQIWFKTLVLVYYTAIYAIYVHYTLLLPISFLHPQYIEAPATAQQNHSWLNCTDEALVLVSDRLNHFIWKGSVKSLWCIKDTPLWSMSFQGSNPWIVPQFSFDPCVPLVLQFRTVCSSQSDVMTTQVVKFFYLYIKLELKVRQFVQFLNRKNENLKE